MYLHIYDRQRHNKNTPDAVASLEYKKARTIFLNDYEIYEITHHKMLTIYLTQHIGTFEWDDWHDR